MSCFFCLQAKAFDRQTSVLHYLVSIVSKNDKDVLRLSEDFGPVKAAERVAVDMLSQQLRELSNGIQMVKKMAKNYSPNQYLAGDKTHDATPEDELLSATPMGKFSLSAESLIKSLTNEFDAAKNSFADLLDFFGEDASLTPEAFFCTINTFVYMFDQANKELKRKEEAKVSISILFCCVVSSVYPQFCFADVILHLRNARNESKKSASFVKKL